MARRADRPTFGAALSHLGVIIAVSAVMGVLIAGLAIPYVGALGLGARAADRSLRSLPEALRPAPLPQRTHVLDARGKVIATFYDQNRVNVPLKDIAPIMRRAIVSIEDYRFYEHGALDVKGTLRAFVTNQTSGTTQGGSSITQQLAKMTAVEQAQTAAQRRAATADTYQRKISELRHAIAFEQNYSKNWILNRYLNIAYFGAGAYGIQSAAQHYFSVDAKDLDVKQAALLAGLVKNPVGYDPTRFPDRATARRNIVLARMAQLKVIGQAEASKLEASPLGLHVKPTSNGCVSSKTPFFCDYVRRYLLADPALGKTVDARKELLNAGGLTIKTTVDQRFERAANAAVRSHVYPTDHAIGAVAEIEPGTGDVKAIAQSRPMGRNAKKGQTYLNYIVPSQYGDSAGFQAGSTFKMFVMAAALQQGIPPSKSFSTPPVMPIVKSTFPDCHGNYPDNGVWMVHNSTDNGPVSNMVTGARLSVNNYFAQLERLTGLCAPYNMAKKMGVQLTDPKHERVPTFTLGVASVSPLEMAEAYATAAARGIHCDSRPVTEILNSDGKVFKKYPEHCSRVMSKYTADTINSILAGLMAPGGFGQYLTLDKPSAGKTGTIDSNMAVWFDGYTPALATASMIAGANQKGHWITLNNQVVGGQFIGTAHGSTTAGPMWADAMRRIQDLLPNKDFVPPSQDTNPNQPQPGPGQVSVPSVTGMSASDAYRTLSDAGLNPTQGHTVPSSLPKGQVAGTSPSAGANVSSGSTVYVYTSGG